MSMKMIMIRMIMMMMTTPEIARFMGKNEIYKFIYNIQSIS